MMEEASNYKEIQNLLDNVEKSAIEGSRKSWRKYARLVLPHVGLVIFVCIYALLGAWIFYSIESPHEDRLKVHGVRRVQELRRQLVKDMMGTNPESGRPSWMAKSRWHLRKFGEDLFRAYKEQYVRFEDVRPTTGTQAQQQPIAQLDPRFRRHFSKSRSEGKMWTPSSALFFAATTMATIGYGNIVPMTINGRIACIIFALLGAPLAIITIGDLGKFLSECTIWLYRRLKDTSRLYRFRFNQHWIAHKRRRRRRLKENFASDELAMDGDLEMDGGGGGDGGMASERERERRRMDEWEEQEKSETEVPVLLVFAILLLYIALGGVLFAFLESWTYMDAFYYCFVSLTTIGFGDLVPDRHEYIVLMLLYLGIGLAVTTMCIDLVGVQYIQKIHYFGRKFQGTDILQILRRKRMLERRLAMGEGKEFIEFVIKQEREALNPMVQPKAIVQPVVHLASQMHDREELQEEEKISLRSEQDEEWPVNEAMVQDVSPSTDLVLAQEVDVPEILEPTLLPRRLSSPTISPSSESERSIMYNRLTSGRVDSWTESGPSVSLKSSPQSTDPSVQQREHFYANYRSPQPSLTSFAYSFPPPSPDLWKIGDAARSSRRLASCPALPPFPAEPLDLGRVRELVYHPLVLDIRPSPPPPEPHPSDQAQEEMAAKMPVANLQQAEEAMVEDPRPSNIQETLPPIARAAAMHEQIGEKAKDASSQANVAQRLLPSFTPSELLGLSSAELRRLSPQQYVLEQRHLLMPDSLQASLNEGEPPEAAAMMDERGRLMYLAASEQQPRLVGYVHAESLADIPQMPSLERLVISELDEPVFIEGGVEEEEEPLFEIDLGAFELVDTGISAEELLTNEDPVIYHKDLPVHSVHHDTVQTEAAIQNLMNAPQSMLSSQIPPTMVADNYCFAVDGDRIQMGDILGDEHWWRHTSRPTKYFYSEDLRRFYRVNLLAVRGKIVSARLANTTPAMGGANTAAEMMAPELAQQGGGGDFLGSASFSLPGTARRSLTFCAGGRPPSFAIPNADPTQIGPTTSSALSATATVGISPLGPSTSLSVFPTGPQIGRHSIAPIAFQQATPGQSGQWRPPAAALPEMAQRGEPVDLGKVYRVVRFYSFWRTCTAFHRIVTMIERVGKTPERSQSQSSRMRTSTELPSSAQSESSSSAAAKSTRPGSSPSRAPPEFQKRLFVQYLWRSIKSGDKARVQREFDPRRQRLLRYVADSAARKRMTGAKMQQFRSGSAGSGSIEQQRHPGQQHASSSRWATPPPGSAASLPSPSPRSARGSIRFRLPSDNQGGPSGAADGGQRTAAAQIRPHSSPGTPMRRAKTTEEIGRRNKARGGGGK